ncbi:hypothetical protein [Saccharothrix lopnurensis]|uniref:NB-ARC domain-containing protein n=1 Tax=Saccharothrix lopnurensis TaxID=1670621 RepID=A0ABW1P417_9PSEU
MIPGTTGDGAHRRIERDPGTNHVSGQVGGSVIQAEVVYGVPPATAVPAATPCQVPLVAHPFVARPEDTDRLDLITAPGPTPVIAVLTGLPGVGKTACALDWARRNADRFAGGLLYADLAAHRHTGGVAVTEVLASFLSALGAPDVPPDLPGRVALFRHLTSRASTLVLLDGVDAPAQVRAVVPASPGSVVLVTSRFRLGGLAVDGARTVALGPLPPALGAALLGSAVPDGRVEADPDSARDLVRLCAGLPIALRAVAARLAERPHWPVSHLVRDLADERTRLDGFAVDGEDPVRQLFDATYEALPAPARLAYRVLGLHPGPEFGRDLAAAATADAGVEDSLRALCRANLLEEFAPDRYRFHDLVHLHARGRAEREDTAAARAEVERRTVRWYRLGASAADHAVLGPARWRVARHDPDRLPDRPSALAWFEAERDNLRSAVRQAHASALHDEVWRTCEALWASHLHHEHHDEWVELHELGVDSARRADNPQAEVQLRHQLARLHVEAGDLVRARVELDRAAAAMSGYERAHALLTETAELLRAEGRPG